jgi:hypothetical protein
MRRRWLASLVGMGKCAGDFSKKKKRARQRTPRRPLLLRITGELDKLWALLEFVSETRRRRCGGENHPRQLNLLLASWSLGYFLTTGCFSRPSVERLAGVGDDRLI